MTLYSLRIYMVFCMDFRLTHMEVSRFRKVCFFLRVIVILDEKISSFLFYSAGED